MARFYLHIVDGDQTIEDLEGAEFSGPDAARDEALISIREVIGHEILSGQGLRLDRSIVIESDGVTTGQILFAEALLPSSPSSERRAVASHIQEGRRSFQAASNVRPSPSHR
jgi:hypothetical protein